MSEPSTERWLRGPVEGVPALLQPVAHALLQVLDEVGLSLKGFNDQQLWEKPAGMASVGFHLQHMLGVLDRLSTYARGEQLSEEQLRYLQSEGIPENDYTTAANLIESLQQKVDQVLVQLRNTDPASLTEARGVGRRMLPSTVFGLLFHSAEHSMRHLGQLLVTVAIIRQQ
ncbi:MAG: DinB family protein [Chitinophagaceae bacterium]